MRFVRTHRAQEASSGASQNIAAATELSAMAADLSNLVGQFRL